jgi:hypothetical protein
MKTMKTTVMMMAVMVWSTYTYASGKVQLNMKPSGNESAMVEIVKSSETDAEVEVTNEYNEVIFYKKLNGSAADYQKKYDFSALEDGKYRMTVNSENETNETWFKIERGDVIIENNRKIMEPLVKADRNLWTMSFLNYPMEHMNLYVYNGNNLMYHKKMKPEFAVHAGLDFSKLLPGTYDIVFSNEHNIFEYEIKVR